MQKLPIWWQTLMNKRSKESLSHPEVLALTQDLSLVVAYDRQSLEE